MKKIKVVYEDDGVDKAIVGTKEAEDDIFLTIIDQYNSSISIAKRRIILIKEME